MISWRVPAALVGLGLAVVGGCLAFNASPWRPLLILAGVLAALTLLDWVIAAPAGELSLRRQGPNQVRLGDTVEVALHITNTSVRTMRAVVRDAWVPSAGAAGPYAHALTIDPDETVTIATELTPTRRGDRPAVRVTVRSYGPLSLAYRQTTGRRADRITPQWTLRTLPEFRSRRLLPEKLARLRVIEGQVVVRGRGQGTEFDSLREYVIGDDPRSIDWRGSARRSSIRRATVRRRRRRRRRCCC